VPAQPSMRKRWLREPLLHFLLAGLALFLVHRALNQPGGFQPKHTERGKTMRTRRRIARRPCSSRALGLIWRPRSPSRRTPSETPTSARPTSTPAGPWMPGSSAIASPIPGTPTNTSKGEPIKHPMGFEVKIDNAAGLGGVTDHSEYVGVMRAGERSKLADQQAARRAALIIRAIPRPRSSESSCMASGF